MCCLDWRLIAECCWDITKGMVVDGCEVKVAAVGGFVVDPVAFPLNIPVKRDASGIGGVQRVMNLQRAFPVNQIVELEALKAQDRVRHARMLQSFPVNHFERSHYFLLKNAAPKLDSKLDAHLKNLYKNGHLSEAVASYSIVKCGSTVRPSTLSHLIDSNSLDLCYKLHGYVRKLREESDPFVETKLVSMYAKCGSLENAFEVFDAMSE
ncbi:Hypothetical predicted protein [Olea europaea subsp. europaea]|uniref:Pentatricopeptide repeat-containing protein n=1 Tax=Olea europaea subsp. europaea TaxID=158383 RepID=A0A8S0TAE1_OLEEU|nr:Hypothetical predicted protein [Olea europaea subsp. europaea]